MSTMRRTLLLLCATAALSTGQALAVRKANPDAAFDACATVDCASGLVCALAIPQSCNASPCPRLPTCLPKNQTCSENSCKGDETCVLRSVTCIKAPCYPVRECAKFPKCGANEEYNECSLSSPCEANCKETFPICSNNMCGSGACECKAGFFRHEGKCISKDQCPEPTCEKPNEIWSTCPSACSQTCRTFRGQGAQMICPAMCGTPACTCAAGYVRDDDDNCVKQEDCPKEFKCPSANEQYAECSSHCEPTCENRTPSCIDSCGPAKCQCKPGYVRNGDHCLLALQCPLEDPRPDGSGESEENSGEKEGASCDGVRCKEGKICSLKHGKAKCAKCGKNEKVDPCPNACSESTCDDDVTLRDCVATRICRQPSCVCEAGFVRDMKSGKCIKKEKCQGGDNMHILPAILPNPLTRPMFPDTNGTAAENGTMHILPAFNSSWTKPLIRPFFPDNDTMHIMPHLDGSGKKECPKHEELNPCPNVCSESTCKSNQGTPCVAPKMCQQPRCVCSEGHVRDEKSGECIKKEKCKKENNMQILPFNLTKPLTRPIFPDNNETVHIMRIPANWTKPLIRPLFPDNENGTMHIMPHIENETMHILPHTMPLVDPIPHIMPFPDNRTRPLIRPFFPDNSTNENGTMHILPHTMPLVDPIPHIMPFPDRSNWTKPLIRPFFPDNETMHIMPHLDDAETDESGEKSEEGPSCNSVRCKEGTACSLKGGKAVCSKCSKNERIDPCPSVCSEFSCNVAVALRDCVAPRMCFLPRCVCEEGFLRNMKSGECVKKEKCPKGDNMQILPFNLTKPLTRPMFPDNNGSVHIMPVFSNWTKPLIRPLFPDNENGTISILPFIPANNGTFHTLPHTLPQVDPMPHIMPFPNNRTKPLIRPMFPDNENGTENGSSPTLKNHTGRDGLHLISGNDRIGYWYWRQLPNGTYLSEVHHSNGTIQIIPNRPENDTMISQPHVPNFNGSKNGTMNILPFLPANRPQILPMLPQVDPMPFPNNRTRPFTRPFFPDNSTAGTGGKMHILPFYPQNDDGAVHIMPVFNNRTRSLIRPAFPDTNGTAADNGTMQILPHWGDGSVHTLPFIPAKNGTMPLKNGTIQTRPFLPGAIHILPANISTSSVCANHTCPKGSVCEETPVMCISITAPCLPIPTCVSVKPNTARDPVVNCDKNEEYSECAPPCQETCRGVECLNKAMAAMCTPGCVCKDHFKRDGHGVCVPNNKCWKTAGCQANEVWSKCRNCEPACVGDFKMCVREDCVSGCGCEDGFVRAPNGECVEQEECPK